MQNFYVLNVGHGNSSVLIDDHRVTVIDAGSRSDLLDFLDKNRIHKIDIIIISHADKDHIGGLIGLVNSDIEIKEVFLNGDSTKDSALWDDLVYSLYEKDRDNKLLLNVSITFDIEKKLNQGSVKFEILAPNKYLVSKGIGGNDLNGRKIVSNSLSVVLRINYKDEKLFLITGDLDDIGLASLLSDHSEINAKVIIFPHHGGKPGNAEITKYVKTLCDATKPDHIIFSIKKNDSHFPHKEILAGIYSSLPIIKMYTTNYSGTFEQFNVNHKITNNKNGAGTIKFNLNVQPLRVELIDLPTNPTLRRK